MIMSRPSWMVAKCYPDYATKWPKAEGYFNSRYVYAHSEFTPQQTMRGKMALYGYLYGMNKAKTQTYTLNVNSSHGTILKNPDKANYNYGDSVTITLLPDADYPLIKWSGDATGTSNTISIAMYSNKNINAEFSFPVGIPQHEESVIGIFPNPACNSFKVTNIGDAGEINLLLSDMNGKLMLQKKITSTLDQVNISGIDQGIYPLRFITRNKVITSKLVVLRN